MPLEVQFFHKIPFAIRQCGSGLTVRRLSGSCCVARPEFGLSGAFKIISVATSSAASRTREAMGVYTFIAKQAGDSWSAKAFSKEDGYDESMTAEAATPMELERALVKLAQSKSSGGVQLSFNMITPKSAVVVVSVGAAAVAVAAPAAGGAAAAAGGAAAAAAPAKKEEPSEEDEDMGFSLFD